MAKAPPVTKPTLRMGRDADAWLVGTIVAGVLLVARPPLYERDGYVYHLLGRDFLGGTNPHHLLWNGVQYLVNRVDALVGIHSVILFQLLGIAFGVASAVLLERLLSRLGADRWLSIVAALFVAFAPWTWFMSFQNQPYALQFLLFILFLSSFVTEDGDLPRGRRFAIAAASAVGMVMLQEAAVLIVSGVAVCVFALGGWRRLAAWAAATGLPTAALYIGIAAMRGVRTPPVFWLWLTGYLRSQHSLQVVFPDFLSRSVMGVISAFVNQDAFKDAVVDVWTPATILWFYGIIGVALAAAFVWTLRGARRTATPGEPRQRAFVWVSAASMLSWGFFCVLWEPTNYYWFILLAPFLAFVVAELRPASRTSRVIATALAIATAWNLYADHDADADGALRAPEPQMRVIDRNMRRDDLLWVVDLGWTNDVDYDLLATISSFDHGPAIRAVSDVVGRSRGEATWERAFADSSQAVVMRGGRVFVSSQAFDSTAYARTWEESPFADYSVERPYPVNWAALGHALPDLLRARYAVALAGFSIGPDTILRLIPKP